MGARTPRIRTWSERSLRAFGNLPDVYKAMLSKLNEQWPAGGRGRWVCFLFLIKQLWHSLTLLTQLNKAAAQKHSGNLLHRVTTSPLALAQACGEWPDYQAGSLRRNEPWLSSSSQHSSRALGSSQTARMGQSCTAGTISQAGVVRSL